MQICTSSQTHNHASIPPLSFFTGQMPLLPHNDHRQSTEGKMANKDTQMHTHTTMTVWNNPGEPVPKETFIHSDLSWSSIVPYQLHPSDKIHNILPVQSTHLTVFFHNLSPSFLWSTPWPGTLHSILHTFLHPIIVSACSLLGVHLRTCKCHYAIHYCSVYVCLCTLRSYRKKPGTNRGPFACEANAITTTLQ